MDITIKWTSEAKRTFQDNINYLRGEWSEREIDSFKRKVSFIIDQLKKYPEMYSPSVQKKGVRKAKVNKRIDLYYLYLPQLNEIHLLTFWNVKRNPTDLSL